MERQRDMNFTPGPLNAITDVAGLRLGHATDDVVGTGVTALLFDGAWTAAVDVRGGGPGVRETETLAVQNVVEGIHGLCLTGGSVFGLSAADGVIDHLSQQGVGMRLRAGGRAIPIVPGAVLHDLNNEGDKDWTESPYRALGRQAAEAAKTGAFALGSVGAGRGAMAGYVKGGIGSASLCLEDGLVVGALAAVNPVGSVFMPDGQTFWAWPFEIGDEFGGRRPGPMEAAVHPAPDETRLRELGRLQAGANTTLAIVATNARLTKAEAQRMAMMAQDGLSRAVRPAHTPFDGDLVFAVASGAVELPEDCSRQWQAARLGSVAADCLARAIARGVFHAAQA